MERTSLNKNQTEMKTWTVMAKEAKEKQYKFALIAEKLVINLWIALNLKKKEKVEVVVAIEAASIVVKKATDLLIVINQRNL